MEPSGVYLNDHLAGSIAGIRLAKRLRDRFAGSDFLRMLDGVLVELEQDRITLEQDRITLEQQVMEVVGVRPNQLKQVDAIAVEVGSRLIHTLPLIGTRSNAIALLEETELLSLGVEGKRLLWAALRRAGQPDARYGRFDFGALEE